MRLMVILILALIVVPGWTQESEISRLRARISDLENRVQQLELLIKRDESANSSLVNENVSPPSRNRANWRRLKVGMTEDEVRRILGEPVRVKNYGYSLDWYYPDGGSVIFRNDRLAQWFEP